MYTYTNLGMYVCMRCHIAMAISCPSQEHCTKDQSDNKKKNFKRMILYYSPSWHAFYEGTLLASRPFSFRAVELYFELLLCLVVAHFG